LIGAEAPPLHWALKRGKSPGFIHRVAPGEERKECEIFAKILVKEEIHF
jgi:hypothetical protein